MMPLAAAAHARPLRLNSSPPLHPTRRALPSCRAPLPAAGTRWQSRSRPQLRSCAASGGGGELKQRIVKTAGDKNGLDLSAEAKKGVEGLIAELEAINPTPNPARVDLGGTKWELVYSSTAGASGGKLGPFIGQVTQVFPAGEGEIYFNIVRRPSSHPRQPSLRARPASALSTPVALAGGVGATQGGPESGIQL
mmetsp:Transcript_24670/g.77891  ORF Transcript_24670/g.77891 Transcript_24670/m.77891 type:complete len:194 (-) Transcript_24670:430-1011(-)